MCDMSISGFTQEECSHFPMFSYIIKKILRVSYHSTAICLYVWAACFLWAACLITTHTAVSQTHWFHVETQLTTGPKLQTAEPILLCYNLVRDTVWSRACHFIWENDFVDPHCLLQPLHPSDFYFRAALMSVEQKMYSSPSVLSSVDRVRQFMSCLSLSLSV